MYEQHFGLKKRPFPMNATLADIFVGPHLVTMMSGLKKSLATEDAVAIVSGAVGSGKTTLVARTLATMGEKHLVISIARMRLDCREILDLLLKQLGADQIPSGVIQQFALFRQKLRELAEQGSRVTIVIEDGGRLGVETLAEIEALTAADSGESAGANLVIMGDENLIQSLETPDLARLRQRIRHGFALNGLPVSELGSYLRHCFRLAEGNFDAIFEANAIDLLHHVSGGIPRVVNNLVESAMRNAADDGATTVSSDLLAAIAKNDYNLSVADFDLTPVSKDVVDVEPEPLSSVDTDLEVIDRPVPDNVVDILPAQDTRPVKDPVAEIDVAQEFLGISQTTEPEEEVETEAAVEAAEAAAAEAAAVEAAAAEAAAVEAAAVEAAAVEAAAVEAAAVEAAAVEAAAVEAAAVEAAAVEAAAVEAEAAAAEAAEAEELESTANSNEIEDSVPELIQDTLPNLKILAPDLLIETSESDAVPVLQTELGRALQTTTNLAEELAEELAEDIPELSVDVADEIPEWERDPTLAQLKPDLDALENALSFVKSDELPVLIAQPPAKETTATELELIPEITLDYAIDQRIESQSQPTDGTTADATLELAQSREDKAKKAEMANIALKLAAATSLEDVDDRVAETLFGDELNLVAAELIRNSEATKPESTNTQAAKPANDEFELILSKEEESPSLAEEIDIGAPAEMEVTLAAPNALDGGAIDLSASQRLKTVRALNADMQPSILEPATPIENQPSPDSLVEPESFENQINLSMTQTLKALKVAPPETDEDEGEQRKGGFFSRFKRS